MKTSMDRIIQTVEELRALRPRPARRNLRRVVLALPGEPLGLRSAERIINRGLQACGCETAAAFLAVGVLVIAVWAVRSSAPAFLASARSWVGVLGGLGAFTLSGKVLGLAIAEWRLRAAIDQITRSQAEPSAPTGTKYRRHSAANR